MRRLVEKIIPICKQYITKSFIHYPCSQLKELSENIDISFVKDILHLRRNLSNHLPRTGTILPYTNHSPRERAKDLNGNDFFVFLDWLDLACFIWAHAQIVWVKGLMNFWWNFGWKDYLGHWSVLWFLFLFCVFKPATAAQLNKFPLTNEKEGDLANPRLHREHQKPKSSIILRWDQSMNRN